MGIFSKKEKLPSGPNLEKATGTRRAWLADNDPTSPYYWHKHVPNIPGNCKSYLDPEAEIDALKRRPEPKQPSNV